MKKIMLYAGLPLAAICMAGCPSDKPDVMARFVPERCDDFIFENDLTCGRLYGKALEDCGKGQVTSPGIDVWVKLPGALVANQRYVDELEHGRTYHKDWGNGKDCYKVSRSLGAGASSPVVDGALCMPATNFRSWEMLEEGPHKVSFKVSYPEWEIPGGVKVSLEKTLTVTPGTYFIQCEDVYNFTGAETLTVLAGINRHVKQKGCFIAEEFGKCGYALWEHASDQSVESEDGLLGIAVVMPAADSVAYLSDSSHAGCFKTVKSGENLAYSFASCWSKGDVKTSEQWFGIVAAEQK